MEKDDKLSTVLGPTYSVFWRYTVNDTNREKFEFEYGPDGTWCNLFNQSNDYRGSFLFKSEDEAGTYILMDVWTTKQAYEAFKKINQETYNQLSARFESLYSSEEQIGNFKSIIGKN